MIRQFTQIEKVILKSRLKNLDETPLAHDWMIAIIDELIDASLLDADNFEKFTSYRRNEKTN